MFVFTFLYFYFFILFFEMVFVVSIPFFFFFFFFFLFRSYCFSISSGIRRDIPAMYKVCLWIKSRCAALFS